MRALGALAVVAGCGRIAFETIGGAGDASDGDAAPAGFCESLPAPVTFCSDFSNGSAGFIGQETINGSYVIEAGGGPTPESGAFVLMTDTLGSGSTAEVSVRISHPTAPTQRVHFSFDVRIDTVGDRFPALGLLALGLPGDDIHGVEYVWSAGSGAELEEFLRPQAGGVLYEYDDVPKIPPGAWHRLGVTVELGSPWKATVSMDAQNVMVDLTWDVNGPFLFHVGVPYLLGPSAPWGIRVSNVVVDVQ